MKTIEFDVDKVKPGDTIYVRAGTYYESVVFHSPGIKSSPITFSDYGDEAVTINGGKLASNPHNEISYL